MDSEKFLETVKAEGLSQNELNSLVQKEYLRELKEIEKDKRNNFQNMSNPNRSIRRLKELTKVPVEYEPVQKIYGLILKTNIRYVKSFRDAVDINPEKEKILETYEHLLYEASEGTMRLIKELENFSGVPLTKEMIQEAYLRHISSNTEFRLDIIKSVTKVKPLETTVQERYVKSLSKGYIEDVDKLEDKTKIPANKEAYLSVIKYLRREEQNS